MRAGVVLRLKGLGWVGGGVERGSDYGERRVKVESEQAQGGLGCKKHTHILKGERRPCTRGILKKKKKKKLLTGELTAADELSDGYDCLVIFTGLRSAYVCVLQPT